MNKTVIVAESSRLVTTFITSELENNGYKVVQVADGFEAIQKIQKVNGSCLLCSATLPVFSGFELSRIIKSRDNLNIPVIIYSISGEPVLEYELSNSLCDDYFVLNTDSSDQLLQKVAEIAQTQNDKKSKSHKNQEISAVNEISGFYQTESELLNIVNSLCSVYETHEDIYTSAFKALKCLSGFVPFDVALITISDENRVFDVCKINDNISKDELEDFLIVGHDFFTSNCQVSQQLQFQDCIFSEEKEEQDRIVTSGEKIKFIESSPLFVDDFIGSITIGSTKSESLTDSYLRRFNFFAEKLSPFVKNMMDRLKVTRKLTNLRKAFSSFVPDEIIDELAEKVDEQVETAGEKRRIAVLICDIRNFTNISEKNKAEDVVSFLNSYFTEMVEIIKKYGGSIDKFMGDAIMALFGAPISYEDNAQRAVNAAVEMMKKLPDIDCSRINLPEGSDHIEIGIGVHYGEVILGSIGCTDKKDYTVIGDSVNLASRLEGLSKLYGCSIVISDFVQKELEDKNGIYRLDKVAVKGKKVPVWIYSVEYENQEEKNIQNYHKIYEKGIDLYEVGAWSLASGYFQQALDILPDSKAAKIMKERCESYIVNPPENWDGSVTLTSK